MTNFKLSFADIALIQDHLESAIAATGFYDADKVASDFPQKVLDLVKEVRAVNASAVEEVNVTRWFNNASDLVDRIRRYVTIHGRG